MSPWVAAILGFSAGWCLASAIAIRRFRRLRDLLNRAGVNVDGLEKVVEVVEAWREDVKKRALP